MEKISISKYQLFAMIILFQIGSTTLFELGIKAKQDAWLVVLIAMMSSLLLLKIYLAIQQRAPDTNLVGILTQYLGTYVGKLIAFLYILYFVYEAMRNVRDFGDLSIMTFLSKTPISIIMLVMMMLSVYVIISGVEVFFRFAEFILAGVLIFYFILIIMFFSSGNVHLDRLLPILENGIMPVIKEVPDAMGFPFGQMVLFLMFWSYLNDKAVMTKTSVIAYFISGTLFIIFNILNIAVLGVPYTSISTIPLLQSVQLIQLADFLERFDTFVILLFYAGIFIKSTLWYLAAVLGLGQILNINYRKLILPIGGIIYFSSFLEPNWVYHLWLGHEVGVKYGVDLIASFTPLVLYLIMLVRGRQK